MNLYGESAQSRSGGPFDLPERFEVMGGESADGEIYLRHQRHGFVAETALLHSDEAHGARGAQLRLNELYTDFSAVGLDLSIGKKVMSSGIGFGFRPLDIIEHEDRRALWHPRLEGVPLFAAEQIDAETARSAIYFNRVDWNGSSIRRGDHELLLRDYRFDGGIERQLLVHLHERLGASPGAGVTWVGGEGLELHGAALYEPRYERPVNMLLQNVIPFSATNPWRLREIHDGSKLLAGGSLTGANGVTLLMEAWHDDSALPAHDWKRLIKVARRQQAFAALLPAAPIYGNIAWNLHAYDGQNALPDNLLLRLSYDGERTDPYIDLLATPADGGGVMTVGVTHEIAQGLTLGFGARAFVGPPNSAYGALPLGRVLFLTLSSEAAK